MSLELIVSREGKAGRITLNRPSALNALTPQMVLDIRKTIEAWRNDEAVEVIIIEGSGEKAFCAGGDIRELYEAGRSGDFEFGAQFWTDEYRLDAALALYPKPIVSFLHGFVMGGGVGIGCHVAHRVIDPEARVAMPECAIGLVPDVGGTLLLAKAPGCIGEYMALTGARINGFEAQYVGFADHVIPRGDWASLIADLIRDGDPTILQSAAQPAQPWPQEQLDNIATVFGLDDLDAIQAAARDTEFEAGLRKASPLSLSIALQLVRRARGLDRIEEALAQELCFTSRASEHADLLEGVRAVLIDRDHAPQWRFVSAEDIPSDVVDELLQPNSASQTLFPDPTSTPEMRT